VVPIGERSELMALVDADAMAVEDRLWKAAPGGGIVMR